MHCFACRAARPSRVVARLTFLGMALAALLPALDAAADDPVRVVRVEEDWELVLSNPDAASVAPQVTTAMSPQGSLDGFYATFEINHKTVPGYRAGGLHLHVWDGETRLSTRDHTSDALAATASETISWTQRLELSNCGLTLEIANGVSTTWGIFGTEGRLRVTVLTSLTSLNGYTPKVSVAQSGIGFASNRAQSLVLKRVRLTTSSGQTIEDATPRVVYQQD